MYFGQTKSQRGHMLNSHFWKILITAVNKLNTKQPYIILAFSEVYIYSSLSEYEIYVNHLHPKSAAHY